MNTKELLEQAAMAAKQNGETLLALHWKNGNCNFIKQGDNDTIAGCIAMILGAGMGDDATESEQCFALCYCVAGATVENELHCVCDTIKDMAEEEKNSEENACKGN